MSSPVVEASPLGEAPVSRSGDAPNQKRLEIELVGRFDAHETPAFLQRIEAILASTSADVSIDLRKVIFIDSIALAELVKLHRSLDGSDRALYLVGPSDPVRVILEVTGLVTLFNIELAGQSAAGIVAVA